MRTEPRDEALGGLESEIAQWVGARRWQLSVTRKVAQVGLRFNEWLVLVTTLKLTRAKQDAVSQNDVCRAIGLTRMQVAVAMRRIDNLGLVSRGPDVDGFMWRVFVTKKGQALVSETNAQVLLCAAEPAHCRASEMAR